MRFICGTQEIHKELEARLSAFLGTEDTILYGSCFDANGGLFETLLGPEDAIISDALNHASIIDGIRLCKAQRHRYANSDMDELEKLLQETAGARRRLIATDGVFSMDGYVAKLDQICDLAERYDAMVMVDDSHAVGFIGEGGRGTPEYHGVMERVDIITGTLGKALGGASGGYTSGRQEIVDAAAPALAAVPVLQHARAADRRRLAEGARAARSPAASCGRSCARTPSASAARMTELGFDILPGDHPIVPIMYGDAALAGKHRRSDARARRLRDRVLVPGRAEGRRRGFARRCPPRTRSRTSTARSRPSRTSERQFRQADRARPARWRPA